MADRRSRMDRVTLRIPKALVRDLETLSSAGLYLNRSEAIRDGCRRLVLELGGEDHDLKTGRRGAEPELLTEDPLEPVEEFDLDTEDELELDPAEEVEKRREWREAALAGDEPDVLDHDDIDDLEQAYREADGVIADAVEQFDCSYGTLRSRFIDHGLHEPAEYGDGTAAVATDGGESDAR